MKLSKAGTFLLPYERALMIEAGCRWSLRVVPFLLNTVTFSRVLGSQESPRQLVTCRV